LSVFINVFFVYPSPQFWSQGEGVVGQALQDILLVNGRDLQNRFRIDILFRFRLLPEDHETTKFQVLKEKA